MFRKAAITAAALIAMAGVLTGCSTNTPYTGTAVVKEHHTSGKSCRATLELPNKENAEFYMGRRSTCYSLNDGATVKIENGDYKK